MSQKWKIPFKAKGKLYCEDSCFNCVTCDINLKEVPVFCKEDALYCEEHYKAKFVPKCARCNDYITEVRNLISILSSYTGSGCPIQIETVRTLCILTL